MFVSCPRDSFPGNYPSPDTQTFEGLVKQATLRPRVFDFAGAPKGPFGPPVPHLNHWLRVADARASIHFNRRLRSYRIITSELAALRLLYRHRGALSPVEIAKGIRMTKGGGSKLVNRLVKKGLAIKTTDDFDRRFRSVQITTRGARVVWRFVDYAETADLTLDVELSADMRDALLAGLQRVAYPLSPPLYENYSRPGSPLCAISKRAPSSSSESSRNCPRDRWRSSASDPSWVRSTRLTSAP